MNILLIDRALPSSVFSGKTVRLKNIYGRLAKEMNVYFLRTAQVGEEKESEELELWTQKTFQKCLRLSPLGRAKFLPRLRTLIGFRPWYDLYSKYPNQIKKISNELRVFVVENKIDVVVTFDNEIAQYGFLLSSTCPWIQDVGDSMVLQVKRQAKEAASFHQRNQLLWRAFRESRLEAEMVAKAHATIYVAEDDASVYRRRNEQGIEVIPNGVDTDYFNRERVEPIRELNPYVVFTGHMSFVPNRDAARFFAREILPAARRSFPNLGFKIVGADPTPDVQELSKIEGVQVTGRVPDVRPYLSGALAFVCPMRMGCGIKNKLLEAMAMELPIAATPLAVRGIDGIPPGVTHIVEDQATFSAALIGILKHHTQSGSVNRQARVFVENQYSWQKTVDSYRQLFRKYQEAFVRT